MLQGSHGLPLIGETLTFLRDPVSFVSARQRLHGGVFRTHLLGQRTIFATTYSAALQVLHAESSKALESGVAYSEFLRVLYPSPNVLLLNSDSVERARIERAFGHLLSPNCVQSNYIGLIREHCERAVKALAPSDTLETCFLPYAFFKRLAEDILHSLLLGKLSKIEDTRAREAARTHFASLLAIPVRASAFGLRTGAAKGADAREELVTLLRRRLREVRKDTEKEGEEEDDNNDHDAPLLRAIASQVDSFDNEHDDGLETGVQHALLLLSHAIPKCIGAAIGAVFEEIASGRAKVSCIASLRMALVECLRLHPPLLGGLRQSCGGVERDVKIENVQIPTQCRVWYSARHANRDEQVFERAHAFDLDRWSTRAEVVQEMRKCPFAKDALRNENLDEMIPPLPLSFGAGDRMCPGRELAWCIMQEGAWEILKAFHVVQEDKRKKNDAEIRVKYMPVRRPVVNSSVTIRRKERR